MTEALEHANINIKESFMFDPVKTIAQIYLLDEGCKDFKVEHNCENCDSTNCPHRNLKQQKITVLYDDKSKDIFVKQNQSLMA